MVLTATLTALALATGVGIGAFAAPRDAAQAGGTAAEPAHRDPAMHRMHERMSSGHMRGMRHCEMREEEMRRHMRSPEMRAMHERMMGEGHAMGAR